MLDIDHFKHINDNHGHAIGDAILKTIADILKSVSRQQDIVVRYGGDEFIVLIKGMNHQQSLERANKIQQQVHDANPHELNVTCSIGLACCDKKQAPALVSLLDDPNLEHHPMLDFATLFEAADQALYQAKEGGRNKVCIHIF